jgi:hypothetical protein
MAALRNDRMFGVMNVQTDTWTYSCIYSWKYQCNRVFNKVFSHQLTCVFLQKFMQAWMNVCRMEGIRECMNICLRQCLFASAPVSDNTFMNVTIC